MNDHFPVGLTLLSSMITPAVLISACGTLIFSTATRLARIVDRVRELSQSMEALFRGEVADFPEERRAEIERQLSFYVRRSRLVQRSLTAFYVALGIFVGATIGIGVATFVPDASFVPGLLGVAGTTELFYGCVLLIREMRLSQKAVDSEMDFTLRLGALYQKRHGLRPGAYTEEEEPNPWERLRRLFQREVEGKGGGKP
jgi:Protein of unknown function (DUF2721)